MLSVSLSELEKPMLSVSLSELEKPMLLWFLRGRESWRETERYGERRRETERDD
jgi:hypothetical protein